MSMTIKEYLDKENLSYKAFAINLAAHGVKITPEAVGHWARGRSKPLNNATFQAVKDCTNGAVTPNSFCNLV